MLVPSPEPNCTLSLCSCMGTVLQGKRNLFRSCFQSVFFLPPNEELQVLEASLCAQVSTARRLQSLRLLWPPRAAL